MADFRDLQVWQKAHQLAIQAYHISKALPAEERYALGDQIRRAAVAIPANIAEGHGRGSNSEFRPFLRIAMGSLSELQALVLIGKDLDYLPSYDLSEFWPLAEEVGKMLGALHAHLSKA